jgi:hypothetical protein
MEVIDQGIEHQTVVTLLHRNLTLVLHGTRVDVRIFV